MKKYQLYIGIDVSKLKLDVNILNPESFQSEHFIIKNDPKEITKFLSSLKRKIELKSVLFCCGNTGIYTNHLSFVLINMQLDLWVVPAIEIKRSNGISRRKSDKVDAKDISFYSFRNQDKIKLHALNDIDIQKLKLLFAEREKMVKILLLLQSTKENESFVDKSIFKEVSKINDSQIKYVKVSIEKIEFRVKQIIKSNDRLYKQSTLLKSIPGLGEQTSLYLLIATKGFTSFNNWRQFACYSGVAPFEYSSGSSIRGRAKVNHMADKKMKSLLQMCAMTALKYDPQIKEYYNKKKAEGKNSMLVLNNIRCKLISRAFAVINRETPYINTYKFAS